MIDPGWCHMMADYNRWMNQRLYECCAGIPDAERRADRGAFFRSIHGTLNHLLWGDSTWMARFLGRTPPAGDTRTVLHDDFAALRRARDAIDEEILGWASGLTTRGLAAPLTWRSRVDGRSRTLATWVVVTHFYNHQTHHRGQLATLLMQAGTDPGETDLLWLPGLSETGA